MRSILEELDIGPGSLYERAGVRELQANLLAPSHERNCDMRRSHLAAVMVGMALGAAASRSA